MLSLIISSIWVCFTTLTMVLKSVFMLASKKDLERASTSISDLKAHHNAFKLGNRYFLVFSFVGLLITFTCFTLGVIKIWVLWVDCIAFVIGLIMNILFLGYLKKRINK
jgi:hypothetical protein